MSPLPDGTSTPAAPGLLGRITARWPRVDGALFPLFAGLAVLHAATAFYGSMHWQTRGVWSAPLDDVFIHFDYARATARGYPFEWSEGNGFSSGNTSPLYPFVLAFGYWVGFRGLSLMIWAALVACVSTFGFLLAAAHLTEPLGRWAKYLLPPAVLALGALDWSLFSGMENAFHLGMWGAMLVATLRVLRAADDPSPVPRVIVRRALLAGGVGALLYATRPESVVCILAFAALATAAAWRRLGPRSGLAALVAVGLPGAAMLAAQMLANRALTGEWTANGAIAKLTVNNPYMTSQEKWDTYLFLLKYVIVRNTNHHFAEHAYLGWIVPAVACVPLLSRRTRALAIVLWASALGWLALVAMNGQVRWQNERYTMSAVAWILVLAALGLGVLLAPLARVERPAWLGRAAFPAALGQAALAAAAAIQFWRGQAPNMRDQIWFFGRASRNIHDQHILAGSVLGKMDTRRVLVGDAGALMYASDRPGLDIIGLGGYHDLPFARAGVHGLGASIELIERMPKGDRPDTMAIYPSWWGDLPTLFGRRLTEVPVYGNVICGGAEKVVYRADWHALDPSGRPRTARAGERVIDELDVADLVSERAHRYAFPRPAMGFVDFRVLADPSYPVVDLFDAGRVIPPGARETAELRMPRGQGRLLLRTAVAHAVEIEATAGGKPLGRASVAPAGAWVEASIPLPAGLPASSEIALTPVGGEWLDCHVWVLEGGDGAANDEGSPPEPPVDDGGSPGKPGSAPKPPVDDGGSPGKPGSAPKPPVDDGGSPGKPGSAPKPPAPR